MKKADRLFEIYDEIKDSMSMSVKIDHVQVYRVVVTELISKRNACKDKYRKSFDNILKGYYLSESEFDKYVVRGEKLK